MAPAVSLAPLAWLAPQEPMKGAMDSLDRRLPVSPEAQEQKDPPVYPARHPVAFHPRKEQQKVQRESLQAFRPGAVEVAAFPQNRWS